jgi:hypothetical protein
MLDQWIAIETEGVVLFQCMFAVYTDSIIQPPSHGPALSKKRISPAAIQEKQPATDETLQRL